MFVCCRNYFIISLCFILCIFIGVRATNLIVPILYKDIVDALVETEIRPSTWPLEFVIYWAVLRLLQVFNTQ